MRTSVGGCVRVEDSKGCLRLVGKKRDWLELNSVKKYGLCKKDIFR